MVMAESVSFIWERGRPARLFRSTPFLLVQTSGRDARLPSKGRSKQVTPIRYARYAPDRPAAVRRRLCLLAASARPHGVLGRAQAGCDDRRARTRKPSSDANDIGCRGGTHQAAATGFPCFFPTR